MASFTKISSNGRSSKKASRRTKRTGVKISLLGSSLSQRVVLSGCFTDGMWVPYRKVLVYLESELTKSTTDSITNILESDRTIRNFYTKHPEPVSLRISLDVFVDSPTSACRKTKSCRLRARVMGQTSSDSAPFSLSPGDSVIL